MKLLISLLIFTFPVLAPAAIVEGVLEDQWCSPLASEPDFCIVMLTTKTDDKVAYVMTRGGYDLLVSSRTDYIFQGDMIRLEAEAFSEELGLEHLALIKALFPAYKAIHTVRPQKVRYIGER